jgi:phosphatidylglycerol lysyltransferase
MAMADAMMRRSGTSFRFLSLAFSLALFGFAVWVLHHELASIRLTDIRRAADAIPMRSLLLAGLATVASYTVLTWYDVLALHYIRRALPYRRVAMASFIATAVGNNLGLAMLSAGSVRMRIYTMWGLAVTDVASLAVWVGLTFAIGAGCAAGMALLFEPRLAASALELSINTVRFLGVASLLLTLGYLSVGHIISRPLRLGNWQIRLPDSGMACKQLVIAVLDLTFAGFALYALIPTHFSIPFSVFLSAYVIAIIAGLLSNVPGGLGVFETVLLLSLPQVPRDVLLASILIYRLIYYLAPLVIAAGISATMASQRFHRHLGSGLLQVKRFIAWTAPRTVSGLVLITGVVLLLSGSLPSEERSIRILRDILPLPILETSHLIGSLIGLALVFLAHALYRRVDAGYHLAFMLLAASLCTSLLKGLDYEEMTVSFFTLSALWLSRSSFNRKASIMAGIYAPGWMLSILLILGASIWLGFFSYKHVEYSHDLWWQFTFEDDAPRFLRASLLTTLVCIGGGLTYLLRPAPLQAALPGKDELQKAACIIVHASHSEANLALLGDKRLLFSDDGQGFIMYQVQGRSWIAMDDPVGPATCRQSLAWKFREMADRHGGRTVFYQIPPASIALYVDMGLTALKLGEEAIVKLRDFALEGRHRSGLRQAHHRAERGGLRFEIAPAWEVPALIPQLKHVSDRWLAEKNAHEKGFSLGFFHAEYLSRFPCALVWHDDALLAFANVWTTADKHELSIDLMRYLPDAPRGIMDYLFIELMLYGSHEGYEQFNLGMAPLAGLENHPLAPLWHRVGTAIFSQGEHFYNFKGLRAYKDKFNPVWQSRYLAAPGGLALPAVLLDVAAVISGGIKGVFSR